MSEPRPDPPAVPRVLPLVLALVGLAVCGVLEAVHVKTYLLPSAGSFCSVSADFDCSTVAMSRLSVLLGLPMPLWGAVGFIAMLLAAWWRLRLLWPLAAFATLASVGLLLEELLHVGSVCLMCEAVHVLSLLLALVAWRWHRKHGQPTTTAALVRVAVLPGALVLVTVVLLPPYWAPLTWQQGVPLPHGTTEDGHPWVGAEQPVLTVEEFVDYGCPHCAIATNRTRRRLAKDGDRLRIVRRHQPRARCNERNHACVTMRAAHCAGQQGKFWEMDAWLFAHAPGRPDVDVLPGAEALGLDQPSFMLCLEDPATYAWADAHSQAARKLKIVATPTYRIDGTRLMPDELEAVLAERL